MRVTRGERSNHNLTLILIHLTCKFSLVLTHPVVSKEQADGHKPSHCVEYTNEGNTILVPLYFARLISIIEVLFLYTVVLVDSWST